MPTGKLIVVTGPMYAGKSTYLQRHIRRMKLVGKKCIIIKHTSDTRYDKPNDCCTHDLHTMPAIAVKSLWELKDQCQNYDIVALEGAQFFHEIVEFVDYLVGQCGKYVIVAALDGTYEGKPFGRIAELLPMSEEFTKLSAVCLDCGGDASFTVRRSDFSGNREKVEVIGGSDLYESLCRSCRAKRKYKNSIVSPQMTIGKLIVVTGPMYAEKSTYLQRHVRRMELGGKKCLIIKHASDIRYDKPNDCCTHDLQTMPAIATKSLWKHVDQCENYDVIALDEIQFFPEIVEFVEELVENMGKIVIAAGLDGTYEGKPFGRVAELLPMSEEFIKLPAVCLDCCGDASFTVRRPDFSGDREKVEVIGGSDLYESLCRSCRDKRFS